MGVFPTENAVKSTTLVWTLLCYVAKLFAITTFDGWVGLDVVARNLVFHLGENVFFKGQHVLIILVFIVRFRHHLIVFLFSLRIITFALQSFSKVHVAFDGASWNNHVGIALGVYG